MLILCIEVFYYEALKRCAKILPNAKKILMKNKRQFLKNNNFEALYTYKGKRIFVKNIFL